MWCRDQDDVAVAAVTAAEMLVGVELASAKYRPTREALVGDVVSSIPIVPYELSVAGEHAKLFAAVLIDTVSGTVFDPFIGRGVSGPLEDQMLDRLPAFTAFPDDYFTFYPDGRIWP